MLDQYSIFDQVTEKWYLRVQISRHDKKCYAVKFIYFNWFGTFATAGADRTITLWDKDPIQSLEADATTPNHTLESAAVRIQQHVNEMNNGEEQVIAHNIVNFVETLAEI